MHNIASDNLEQEVLQGLAKIFEFFESKSSRSCAETPRTLLSSLSRSRSQIPTFMMIHSGKASSPLPSRKRLKEPCWGNIRDSKVKAAARVNLTFPNRPKPQQFNGTLRRDRKLEQGAHGLFNARELRIRRCPIGLIFSKELQRSRERERSSVFSRN